MSDHNSNSSEAYLDACFSDEIGRDVLRAFHRLGTQLQNDEEGVNVAAVVDESLAAFHQHQQDLLYEKMKRSQALRDTIVDEDSDEQNEWLEENINRDYSEISPPKVVQNAGITTAKPITQNTAPSKKPTPATTPVATEPAKSHEFKGHQNKHEDEESEELDEIMYKPTSHAHFEEVVITDTFMGSTEDEWIDDDETGYFYVKISDDEFEHLEQISKKGKQVAKKLSADISSWETADRDLKSESGYKGYDDDLKEVEKSISSIKVSGGSAEVGKLLADGSFGNVNKSPKNSSSAGKKDEPKSGVGYDVQGRPRRGYYVEVKPNRTTQYILGLPSNDNIAKEDPALPSDILGQSHLQGVDGSVHAFFNLKVIFEPNTTGFEDKEYNPPKGSIVAGRYQVKEVLGQAAFSTALQCIDLESSVYAEEEQWVCLKVIKNKKDFFDQSIDEIKLLQLINSCGDPDKNNFIRLIDYFYFKEHLFIVTELLKENLYEFGKYVRDSQLEPYFTLPRLKKICRQVLEALDYIHSLNLIHCDLKPENIVIKSYSRCEVKLIDFGSSCFTTDYLSTYIQSRSYRAPEVVLGHPYDGRIDIWSLGAVAAEMYTGYVLFQNDTLASMLARIIGIIGPFPAHVLERGRETPKYFTAGNSVVYEKNEDGEISLIYPKKTNLASRLHVRDELPSISRSDNRKLSDEALFIDFVAETLNLDPVTRPTSKQSLKHQWLMGAYDIDFTKIDSVYAAPQPASDPADEEGADVEEEEDDDEGEEDEDEEAEDEGEEEEAEEEAAELEDLDDGRADANNFDEDEDDDDVYEDIEDDEEAEYDENEDDDENDRDSSDIEVEHDQVYYDETLFVKGSMMDHYTSLLNSFQGFSSDQLGSDEDSDEDVVASSRSPAGDAKPSERSKQDVSHLDEDIDDVDN